MRDRRRPRENQRPVPRAAQLRVRVSLVLFAPIRLDAPPGLGAPRDLSAPTDLSAPRDLGAPLDLDAPPGLHAPLSHSTSRDYVVRAALRDRHFAREQQIPRAADGLCHRSYGLRHRSCGLLASAHRTDLHDRAPHAACRDHVARSGYFDRRLARDEISLGQYLAQRPAHQNAWNAQGGWRVQKDDPR
jgi:hypothetical protein